MHTRPLIAVTLVTAALLAIPFVPIFAQVTNANAATGTDPTAADITQREKDNIETGSYVLTMDKITRTYEMDYELVQLGKSDPTLKAHLNKIANSSQGTIDETTAIKSQFPDVVAIIAKHGFTPHESVLAELALFRTVLAAISIEEGEDRATLVAQMHLNPANIDFVNQHAPEIKALDAKYPTASSEY